MKTIVTGICVFFCTAIIATVMWLGWSWALDKTQNYGGRPTVPPTISR